MSRFKTQAEEDAEKLERAKLLAQKLVQYGEQRVAANLARKQAAYEAELARVAQLPTTDGGPP